MTAHQPDFDGRRFIVAVDCERAAGWHERCVDALTAAGHDTAMRYLPGRAATPAESVAKRVAHRLSNPLLRSGGTVVRPYDDRLNGDIVVDVRERRTPLDPAWTVMTFRFGDDAELGALPLARAFGRGDRTICVTLELTEGASDVVLREGTFGLPFWYPSAVRHILREISEWPSLVDTRPTLNAQASRSEHVAIGWGDLARFLISAGARVAGEVARRLFVQSDWAIALTRCTPAELLAGSRPSDLRWIANPDGGFFADPFLCRDGDVTALFYEAYDDVRGRGIIDAAIVGEDGSLLEARTIIDEPYHLSYPSIVRSDGRLYLVPEAASSQAVVAYRCDRFPFEWRRELTLLDGIDAVDTTIFERDGRWWLFCTRWSRNSMLNLFAFSSDAFAGPYHAHERNPVVTDIRASRPAGMPFAIGGRLIRPAQDCSDGYGSALNFREILELTPERYREVPYTRMESTVLGNRWDGIHTVSSGGGWTALDGKSERWSLRALQRFAQNFMRRAKSHFLKAR